MPGRILRGECGKKPQGPIISTGSVVWGFLLCARQAKNLDGDFHSLEGIRRAFQKQVRGIACSSLRATPTEMSSYPACLLLVGSKPAPSTGNVNLRPCMSRPRVGPRPSVTETLVSQHLLHRTIECAHTMANKKCAWSIPLASTWSRSDEHGILPEGVGAAPNNSRFLSETSRPIREPPATA
jgi:hypothetical protein